MSHRKRITTMPLELAGSATLDDAIYELIDTGWRPWGGDLGRDLYGVQSVLARRFGVSRQRVGQIVHARLADIDASQFASAQRTITNRDRARGTQ